MIKLKQIKTIYMPKENIGQAWKEFDNKMNQLQNKQLETLNKLNQRLADRKIKQLQEKIK